MKLEAVSNGRILASDGRRVLFEGKQGGFGVRSRLPAPADRTQRLVVHGPGRRLIERVVGRYLTTNVWPLDDDVLLASVGRELHVTHDDGRTWTASHTLPASSGLRGVMPGAVCVHDGSVYLGEYPLAEHDTPRILRSDDEGRTWDVVVELDSVRHVHAIQVDPVTDDIWVTTGDTDPECRISRLRDGELEVVVSGSQRFRAVELAFTPDAILWGVDCAFLASNELLRLARDDISAANPTPDVVGTVDKSVYHSATLTVDGSTWVVFSTAGEFGSDRTAPEESQSPSQYGPQVVAASAATGYRDWHVLDRFEHTWAVADLPGFDAVLPRASAYVFLATHPDRGLLVNPYNAVPGDGTITTIPPAVFRQLESGPDKTSRSIQKSN